MYRSQELSWNHSVACYYKSFGNSIEGPNTAVRRTTAEQPPARIHQAFLPINCSLIMEEVIRDRKDSGRPVFAAFLDVKSAFDVVPHDSLLR